MQNRQYILTVFLLFLTPALRYIYQHIAAILSHYDGSLPLTHFLKNYYKQYPKLGSRDRKILSEMAYCWYRAERGLNPALSFEDRIHAALFLCASNQKVINPLLPDALKLNDGLSYAQKQEVLNLHFASGNVFSLQSLWGFDTKLSDGIDMQQWLQTMLSQPDMFIRIRRNKEKLSGILQSHSISYKEITADCIALPNGSKIDEILPEADYVVQDASSQQTGSFFHPLPKQHWWDCCSGAGGKSLLLTDKQPAIKLTVSDTRESILHNLIQRFKRYGLPLPATVKADIANEKDVQLQLGTATFDGIICDVPCTGSGTWARTPEQLYFFREDTLRQITGVQKSIAANAVSHLKAGGTIIYITCSVFREENEDVVTHILLQSSNIELISMQLINGAAVHADSMFVAVLKKKG